MEGAGLGGRVIAVEVGDPVSAGGDHHGLVWPSSTASRVNSMKAATSEPRKVSPSPTPTTRGWTGGRPRWCPGLRRGRRPA